MPERSPAEVFAEHCRRRELAYQVDGAGRPVFRPRAGRFAWRVSQGRGTVHATAVVRPREEPPRSVVLVDLDEGFRMMSTVRGAAPEDVGIGARVRLAWEPGDPPVPVFEPAEGDTARAAADGGAACGGALVPAAHAPPRTGRALRGAVAIAGAAESSVGQAAPGMSAADVMADAARAALADAGLEPGDVDGLFASSTQLPWASVSLGEDLGIRPRYSDSTMVGGSSPIAHLNHARAAIAAGLCDVALVAYGSTQRTVGRSRASVQEVDPYEAPYRPLLPVTAYALAASRHMHAFGTTPEQLAAVAVAAREWALRNPRARASEPLTVDDVLGAPRVCDPLGVRDCCLVTDGGGALVVTSAQRARALRPDPVLVLGVGEAHAHRHISSMPDLTVTAAAESGARAFAEAGLGPGDVQAAQLYDAFTITPILFLEDLGFCAKGEGGPFAASGAIAPGGALPVNTNGGGLSYAHPGMYGLLLLVEAVRQVREAGRDVVLAHGNGGVLSSQCTAILGSAATA